MIRIFCVGNRDRGDDAAAVLVAERLQQLGINAEVYAGDPLAIMERWNPADDVIVVDAMVTGARVGSVQVFEVPLPSQFLGTGSSTHGVGVAEAIRLAHAMGRLPRRLRVYGIEGKQFQQGTEISSEVKSAAANLAMQIANDRPALSMLR